MNNTKTTTKKNKSLVERYIMVRQQYLKGYFIDTPRYQPIVDHLLAILHPHRAKLTTHKKLTLMDIVYANQDQVMAILSNSEIN